MMLAPTQASPIVGVPVVQLLRWAVLGCAGPRSEELRHKAQTDVCGGGFAAVVTGEAVKTRLSRSV